MTPIRPGISYSTQQAETKGNKIVLKKKDGSSKGTGVGVTTATTASQNLSNTTRKSVFTRVTTSKDVGNVANANYRSAARSNTTALYSNDMDYSQLRANLNRNTGFSNQVRYTRPAAVVQRQDNSMNKYAAAMVAMQALQQGIGLLGSLNSKSDVKGSGNNNNVGNSSNTSTSSRSDDSSYTGMSEMKGAKDSVSLRSAIETANADKTKMQSELTQIESGLDAKKADAEKAKADMASIEKDISEQKEVVTKKEKAVEGAKTNLKEAADAETRTKDQLKVAEDRLKSADTAFSNASNALATAESNLSKAAANKDPKTGLPVEPAYTQAKQAVETAKENKQKALDELKSAESDKKTAAENYEGAVKKHEAAEKDLNEKTANLETAEKELAKEEETLKQLKEKQDAADKAIDSYENDLKQKEKLTKDIKKYDDEIKEQGERLKELEKKDDSDLKKVDSKMDELQKKMGIREDKIDTNDGKNTLREKIAAKKNDKALAKFDEIQQERNEIQQRIDVRKLMNNVPEMRTETGENMRKGTGTDGKTIYMIGSKVVDEAAYNTKLTSAKNVYNNTTLDAKASGNLASMASSAGDLSKIKIAPKGSTQTASASQTRGGATNPISAPTTEAALQLLAKGKLPNGTKIGGKIVTYNNGIYLADGVQVKRSELEKLSLG